MTERRRLDLSAIDDWMGELSFVNGEVYGTSAPRVERTRGLNFRRIRDLMHRVFPGSLVDTGHMRRVARTVPRTRFIVAVDVHGEFGEYVVSLPNSSREDQAPSPGADMGDESDWAGDADPAHADAPPDAHELAYRERARREFRILAELAREPALQFRAPRPVALVLDGDAPVLVVGHVAGVELQAQPQDALPLAAAVAAELHRLDVDAPGAATRREAALVEVRALESGTYGTDGPHESLVRDATSFARSMLPPDEPTRFVHHRLSARTILASSHPGEDRRPGVIDFNNAARGDPAQEIASLVRELRDVDADAAIDVARFLDEYARAGGAPIEATDVHVYEALQLAWRLRMTSSQEPAASAPHARRLVALLKRS